VYSVDECSEFYRFIGTVRRRVDGGWKRGVVCRARVWTTHWPVPQPRLLTSARHDARCWSGRRNRDLRCRWGWAGSTLVCQRDRGARSRHGGRRCTVVCQRSTAEWRSGCDQRLIVPGVSASFIIGCSVEHSTRLNTATLTNRQRSSVGWFQTRWTVGL